MEAFVREGQDFVLDRRRNTSAGIITQAENRKAYKSTSPAGAMSYHVGLGRGDIVAGGPDRLRATSGGGPLVMPFGSSTTGIGSSGATSGTTPFGSSNTGLGSGGGTLGVTTSGMVPSANLGVTSTSRGVLSQAGSWGTGLAANSDVGELRLHW